MMIKKFVKVLELAPVLQDNLTCFQKIGKINQKELKILKEVIMILQPFLEATDEWQRDTESIGSVIPAYCHLKNVLQDYSKPVSNVTYCKAFAKTLLASLEKRLSYVLSDTFYILAAFLDPRYKLGWVSSAGLTEPAVKNALIDLLEEQHRKFGRLHIYL